MADCVHHLPSKMKLLIYETFRLHAHHKTFSFFQNCASQWEEKKKEKGVWVCRVSFQVFVYESLVVFHKAENNSELQSKI